MNYSNKTLVDYAEEFMRLGYRIAQENSSIAESWNIGEYFGSEIVWDDADRELEATIEEMKKATLGQESSQENSNQLELDFSTKTGG